LGCIQAFSEHFKGDVGILHFDAHHDFRESYQGFKQSHASIMRNVMSLKTPPKKMVQVGIRDFCEEEMTFGEKHPSVTVFYDRAIKQAQFDGKSWTSICQKICDELPENVYISFDIDGLDPSLCPSTGTPVPGGLQYEETMYLLEALVASGRKVVGFDLCEVTPHPTSEWDANVGARVLYKLCGTILSET
jgi:agmatinase